MGTKLGGVEIPIKLDLSQVNRQLMGLERKVAVDKERGLLTGAKGGPGVAPFRSESGAHLERQYAQQIKNATLEEVRQKISGNVASSQAIGTLGRVAPFIPKEVLPAVSAAGKAAIAYGIASEGVKLFPETFALGRRISGEGTIEPSGNLAIDTMQQILEGWKARVVALESKVTALYTAAQKTVQLNTAVERLTGQLPNSRYYYQFFREYDEGERKLNSRFDTWKAREAPVVTAQTFFDIFRRSIFR